MLYSKDIQWLNGLKKKKKKQDPYICCLKEIQLQTEIKEMKKCIPCIQKLKAGVAVLTSDKTEF